MSTLPSQSFQCSHCVLIFKSKFFLLEHLSKVHGLGVDTDSPPSLKTNTPSSNLKHNTNSDDDSQGSLTCQHCTFTASNWDVVDRHERAFHQKSGKKVEPLQIQKRYLKGKLHIIRRPGIQAVATKNKKKNAVNKMSRPQHEDETGAKVNSSTSKAKCTSNSSPDLKTYKRPSGPITKFLLPPVSKLKYPPTSVTLPDPPQPSGTAKETLILHNPHLSTAEDGTGVLKVTATSQHDLCIRRGVLATNAQVDLLVREQLMVGGLVKGSVSTEIGKRAHEGISVSPPKKRPKTDVRVTESLESPAVEGKLSCSSNFAFEVSEDEEEGDNPTHEVDVKDKGDNLIHEVEGKVDAVKVEQPLTHSCKHCPHKDMDDDDVLSHYENVHPYIRCSSTYMMDPYNRTARFRCLECPVEYPYVADLRLHYRVSHPEAPDVFQMQSHALCFKCFVCPFTTLSSESLKDHYQKLHPSYIVINPLIYCKFNVMSKKEMSQVNVCENESIPKTNQGSRLIDLSLVDQGSLKSAATPDKEVPPVEMSQVDTCEKTPSPKTADQGSFNSATKMHKNTEAAPPQKEPNSKGVDKELLRCKNCTFTHMSPVALLVHYQRQHPERGVSIDQIKMAHIKSQAQPQAPLPPERNSEPSASVSSTNKSLVSPQTTMSDSLKEAKDETEFSHQKAISDSRVKTEDSPATSPLKASGPFQSQCGESPGKRVNLSDVDPEEVDKLFFCQLCNYSDPTVRGIWSHQRASHGITQRNSEEIHLHTAAIRSRCKTSAVTTVCSPQKIADTFAGIPSSVSSQRAEMFFCHLCDHHDPTMKGIMGHLNSQHVGHAVTTVNILMHSAKVNKERAHHKATVELLMHSAKVKKERAQHKAMASASSSVLNTSNWPAADLTDLSSLGAGLLVCKFCHYGHPTLKGVLNHQAKRHSKLKRSADEILRYTSIIRRQIQESTASPTKNLALTPTGLPLPIIKKGEGDMLFCHLCNFRQTVISRVTDHYRHNHLEVDPTHEEIVSYSRWVHERTRGRADNPVGKADGPVGNHDAERTRGLADNPVGKADNPVGNHDAIYPIKHHTLEGLFFCSKCHYGQPEVKSVLAHQIKKHVEKSTTDEILRYTSIIRRKIKELKPLTKKLALTSTGLPLPIIEEGDQETLFCHVCNFPHKLLTHLVLHFKKRHPGVLPTDQEIVSYSLGIHGQMEQLSQMGMPAEQVWKRTSIVQVGNEEAQTSKLGQTASIPTLASKNADLTRSLRCPKCTYCNPRVYLLKRHIANKHRVRLTVPQILSIAFKDGSLPAGYHCEWCVFSHTSAAIVFRHCQKKHSLKGISLKHISMRLYAGPAVSALKKKSIFEKKKPQQQSDKNETKVYPCRECSFKGSTLESISSHSREVHPWIIKNVPTGLPSPEMSFQCPFCPAAFFKSHGLNTHLGKKHPQYQAPLSEDEKEDELDSIECTNDKIKGELDSNEYTGDLHIVYKCPRCAYVNTGFRGVLAHCQSRHPTFQARMDMLQTTKAQFPYQKECSLKKAGLGGYMCRICPIARGSAEKLKLHYEQDHNQTAPNFLKPAPNQSNVIKKQLLSKYRSMQSSALQATFFKNKMPGGLKCNLCKHVANTKIGLSRHLNKHHRKESEAGNTAYYACALCPTYSTHVQEYLGKHYKRTHGIAAFLAYYAKVFNARVYSKTSTRGSSTPLKCQLCDYSSVHRRYLQGHYKSAHGHAALNTYLPYKYQNKRRQEIQCEDSRKAPEAEQESCSPVQCKKCNRTFRSPEFLAIHFTHFHREDFGADFSLIKSKNYVYEAWRRRWYQCGHCSLKIRGTKKLCSHLDDHRRLCMEKANAVRMTTTTADVGKQPPSHPLKVKRQEELQEFETIEDLAKWNVAKVETFTLALSPPSQPPPPPPPSSPPRSRPSSASRMDEDAIDPEPFACKGCSRTFASIVGLRVHERTHGDVADLQQVDTLPVSEGLDKYIRYKDGIAKPFHCGLCSYRTGFLGLIRSHLVRKHGAEISSGGDVAETKPAATAGWPRPPLDLEEDNCWSEPPDEPQFTEVYSEPPEVQRQLGHYKLKRQASESAPHPAPPEDGVLCCELCNFSSGHLSSIRRHYASRHNKKLLRCKDCSFFTGSRKTLEKHVESGHSNCPSQPTHQKDLRCPLCLYQSKNKNNMIDHVMLHREERVVPIEVRRPKLSRYLEGIVFRCHKCTFTSSTAEGLGLHSTSKHDDLKPYKCRLCFFDCTLLSDLEAHLCDKHQVVRNHELVGQVNVDLLEARVLKKEVQKNKAGEDATKRERPEDSPSEQCKREDSPSEQCKREDSPSEQCSRGDSPSEECTREDSPSEPCKREDSPSEQCKREDSLSEECKEDGTVHCKVPVEDGFSRTKQSSRTAFQERGQETPKILIVIKRPTWQLNRAADQKCRQEEDTTNTSVGTEHMDISTRAPQKGGAGEEDETSHGEEPDAKSQEGSFLSCEEDQDSETDTDELVDAYEELPILNDDSQGRVFPKDKWSGTPVVLAQPEEGEKIPGDHSYALPEPGGEEEDEEICGAPALDGDDSDGDMVCGVVMEEAFVCTLCGRYLSSGAELERHVLQHGL